MPCRRPTRALLALTLALAACTNAERESAVLDVGADAVLDAGAALDSSDDAELDASDVVTRDVETDADAGETVDAYARDASVEPGAPVCRATCAVLDAQAPASSSVTTTIPAALTCSADATTAPDAGRLTWSWELVEHPEGSHATAWFDADTGEAGALIDLAGAWRWHVSATDEQGRTCLPAVVEVDAQPDGLLQVVLLWAPDDDQSSDIDGGPDLDLHLLHPNGCWEDELWDCHFRAPNPNWGAIDASDDDPRLLDDGHNTAAFGLESIAASALERGTTYRVGVHYWHDHGYGAANARMYLYFAGRLVLDAAHRFESVDEFWVVASPEWPSGAVTLIDRVTLGAPSCE